MPRSPNVTYSSLFSRWVPLAVSWVALVAEYPMILALIGRMGHGHDSIAAFGGVISPLFILDEAAILSSLTISATLSTSEENLRRVRGLMLRIALVLSAVLFLIVLTPAYKVLLLDIMQIPPELLEPCRQGLFILSPCAIFVAYRRTLQGALIRMGRSSAITVGTVIRLALVCTTLMTILNSFRVHGAVAASAANATGMVGEALFVHFMYARSKKSFGMPADTPAPLLEIRDILKFSLPLMATTILFTAAQPLYSAAILRMPLPDDSLASFSVVSGFLIIFRGIAFSFSELVVAVLDKKENLPVLQRFVFTITAALTATMLLLPLTGLDRFWFQGIVGVEGQVLKLSLDAFTWGLLLPTLTAAVLWYQSRLTALRATAPVAWSGALSVLLSGAVLYCSVDRTLPLDGPVAGIAALYAGLVGQLAVFAWWLYAKIPDGSVTWTAPGPEQDQVPLFPRGAAMAGEASPISQEPL